MFMSLPAHCKNSIDGQWYCFDDSDVHSIAEDHVCKQTAYILFYQRRATIPSWSANSSVGGTFSLLLQSLALVGGQSTNQSINQMIYFWLIICTFICPSSRVHQLLAVRTLDQQADREPAAQPGLLWVLQANLAGLPLRVRRVRCGTERRRW